MPIKFQRVTDWTSVQQALDWFARKFPLTGQYLANGAVGTAQLADSSVTSAKVVDGTLATADYANASVTADKLADAAKLGLTDSTSTRRGKSIIATTESRTNTAYGTLTTPDQVSNLVLPTDGLLVVAYQATWQESVDNAAAAAIFIGANQLRIATNSGGPPLASPATIGGGNPGHDVPLATYPIGLVTFGDAASGYTGDVTTGQVISNGSSVGGPCFIFAAAGTYTVGIQFKAASGSVTAKNRKLWVWTLGF